MSAASVGGAWRPKLRDDVVLHPPGQDGRAAIHDPVIDRLIDLGPVPYAVARRLDGTHTLGDLVAACGDAGPEVVHGAVRMLAALCALDGAGQDTLARIRALRAGGEPALWLLPGQRFGCQASGECCQNYFLGPLREGDVARIEALDVAGRFPEAGPGPWHIEQISNGRVVQFLRAVDDRCVFLQDDRLCGLHARFGPESKPVMCRTYPYSQSLTFRGVHIHDRGACSTFATSARAGLPLAEDLPRLRPLLRDDDALYHPIVHHAEGVMCDFAHHVALVDALLDDATCHPGPLPVALAAIARRARAFGQALAHAPVAPGEPDRALAAALAAPPPAPPPAPGGDLAAGARALDALTAGLFDATTRLIPMLRRTVTTTQYPARLSREVAPLLHLLQAFARHLAAGVPLDEHHRRVASVRAAGPGVDEVLRTSLRQQIFGAHAIVHNRVPAGFARLAMIQLLAIFGARAQAAAAGRDAVVPEDLSYSHMLGVRLLQLGDAPQAFLDLGDDAWPLLDALPALARGLEPG